MNLISLIRLLMPLLLELLRGINSSEDCPGGICDEAESEVSQLNADLTGPSTQNFGDFIRCVDIQRLVAAIREIVVVVSEGLAGCPAVEETTED